MGILMDQWKGRTFQGKTTLGELHSDSSQEAWAGVDVTAGTLVQEFLERKTLFAHKCEGVGGSNKHGAIFGTAKRTCASKSGQFSNLLVSEKKVEARYPA